MSTREQHLATTHRIYQAFGQGDIAGLLACLSPQVQWDLLGDNLAQRGGVPWLQPRRGHDEVMAFFQLVGGWTFERFEVLDMMASDQQVAVQIALEATVQPGGARLRDNEVHLWHFDAQGRVDRLSHVVDTAQHLRAAGLPLPA